MLTNDNIIQLFNKVFLNPKETLTMNVELYSIFRFLLISTNIIEGRLEETKDRCVVISDELIGVPVLWKVVFNSEDKKVKSEAANLLIELYYSLGKRVADIVPNIARSFFTFAFKTAEEDLMQAINLIKSYILRVDGERPAKMKMAAYRANPLIELELDIRRNMTPSSKMSLEICKNLTMLDLKKYISSIIQVPISQFGLKLKYYPLEFKTSYDEEIIKDAIMGNRYLEVVVKEKYVDPKKTASYAIANSDKARVILLNLMSKNENYSMTVWSLIKDLNKEITKYKMINNPKAPKPILLNMWNEILKPNNTLYELLWNLNDIKKLILDNIHGIANNYTNYYINNKLLIYLIETYRLLTNDLKEIAQMHTKIKNTKYTSILIFYFLS